jgi:hypothetical protein
MPSPTTVNTYIFPFNLALHNTETNLNMFPLKRFEKSFYLGKHPSSSAMSYPDSMANLFNGNMFKFVSVLCRASEIKVNI